MQKITFRFAVRCAIVVAATAAFATSASAGGFMRGCAGRDLQLQQLIKDRENVRAISAQKLNETINSMLHARIVCHQGYVVDALTIYDGIANSIAAEQMTIGQNQ